MVEKCNMFDKICIRFWNGSWKWCPELYGWKWCLFRQSNPLKLETKPLPWVLSPVHPLTTEVWILIRDLQLRHGQPCQPLSATSSFRESAHRCIYVHILYAKKIYAKMDLACLCTFIGGKGCFFLLQLASMIFVPLEDSTIWRQKPTELDAQLISTQSVGNSNLKILIKCLFPFHRVKCVHSWKKCFCLREPVFWGSTFLISRLNFPNFEPQLS